MGCCLSADRGPSRYEAPPDETGELQSPLTAAGELANLSQRSVEQLKLDTISVKELHAWIVELNPRLLTHAAGYASGRALSSQVKAELARGDIQSFAKAQRLSFVEAATLLLHTAGTGLSVELWRCIERKGPLALFEPYLLPLLSGMARLPAFSGRCFRLRRSPGGRKGDTVMSSCIGLLGCASVAAATDKPPAERYKEADFLNERMTFFGPSSCSAKDLSSEQRAVLADVVAGSSSSGAIHYDLLCIQSVHAKAMGPLRFSSCPLDEEEVLFPPRWRGMVVAKVGVEWTALLGAVWGVDLSAVHLLEVVDDNGQKLHPDDVPPPSKGASFTVKEICELCQSKFERDKSDLASCRQIVEMYRLAGREDLQLSHLEFWLAQDPLSYDAHVALALLLENPTNNKPRQAAEHYARAMHICPKDAAIHCRLGLLRETHFKDPLAAKAEYEFALRLRPNDTDAHAFLGRVLEERALTASGTTKDMGPAGKGLAEDDDDHPVARAKGHYEAALLVDPSHPVASFLLGRLLWRAAMFTTKPLLQKEIKQIDMLLSTAVESDKGSADYRFWYGRFLADPRVGRYADAKFQLDLAVYISPVHSEAHTILGKLLVEQFPEDRKRSRDHVMMALQLNPRNGGAQTTLSTHFEHEDLDPVTAKRYLGYMLTSDANLVEEPAAVAAPKAPGRKRMAAWSQ